MEQLNCLRCAYRHEDNGNCTATGGFCTAVPAAHCRLLQEYLDTGLPPEEVNDAVVGAKLMAKSKLVSAFGVAAERLRELAEADKAGRLMVLPCKDWLDVVFGDQVLFLGIDRDYMERQIREISVDDADRIGWYDGYKTVFLKGTDENGEAWEFYPEEIGKTVFLTREEAKAALEAMKDE